MEPKNRRVKEGWDYTEDGKPFLPSEIGVKELPFLPPHVIISMADVFAIRAMNVDAQGVEKAAMACEYVGIDIMLQEYCLYFIHALANNIETVLWRSKVRTCCLDHTLTDCVYYGVDPFVSLVDPDKISGHNEMMQKFSIIKNN